MYAVERTFGWLNAARRLAKEFEISVLIEEAMIRFAASSLMKTASKTIAQKSVLLRDSKHLALHTILRFLSSIPNLTVVVYNNIIGILSNCKDNL